MWILIAALASGSSAGEELETMAAAAGQLVVQGNNHFALELYRKLCGRDGNLFFSPYSISTALAMTYAGARETTAEQMAEALRLPTSAKVLADMKAPGEPMTQEEFAEAFGEIAKDLRGRGGQEKYELRVANALWGQKDYAFLHSFIEQVEAAYAGKLEDVDFVTAAEKARQTINAWVEKQTNGKIKDLISQGVLDAMTRLVLTNAIYFKGNWATQFKEARTREAPFTLADGGTVQTPMMNQRESFGYAETDTLQVLEMPYVGKELSMVILLPKKMSGLGALERQLSAEHLAQWLDPLAQREVVVSIPKFKMTDKFSLGPVLASMGMPLAFSREADFSGMTGGRDLYISSVIHQAYVDVNEEGTEAAAATAVTMRLTSIGPDRTPIFRADHPFIFMIRDTVSGGILFLGRVMNPQRET